MSCDFVAVGLLWVLLNSERSGPVPQGGEPPRTKITACAAWEAVAP